MKKIKIYKDPEHQKRVEIEESLKKSPAERIAEVVELIKRVYPIKSTNEKKKIHFMR